MTRVQMNGRRQLLNGDCSGVELKRLAIVKKRTPRRSRALNLTTLIDVIDKVQAPGAVMFQFSN
jgi:hypothetical protein